MRETLEAILDLQPEYHHNASPAMVQRGKLLTRGLRPKLQQILAHRKDLSKLGWDVEASNGKGNNAVVPWVRIYDKALSPSATIGWYIVFLFDAVGDSAYFALMPGTSMWSASRDGFVARPPKLVIQRAAWAREILAPHADGLATSIDLNSSADQPAGYERGAVYSIKYDSGSVPTDDVLADDVERMSALLVELYARVSLTPFIPGDTAPEVHDAAVAADQTAGNDRKVSRSGQGYMLSVPEKNAIERRAIQVATDHFKLEKYKVRDVGATKSYDLQVTKPGEELHVEVKGTTSLGGEIILTYNEVEYHRARFPANALVVVRSIALDRTVSPPVASGGEFEIVTPWEINTSSLKPVSYRYTTGID